MTATPRTRAGPKMGRKRAEPLPPRQPGDPWNLKLARLIEKKAPARKLTKKGLAAAAGITPVYLSTLLSGVNANPSFQVILDLLAALDASLCDLDRA
jgi:DNA-binding Xre family transcriptional regulator